MIAATCAECKREGRFAFEIFPYYLGRHNGQSVRRDAHRECARKLYDKWIAWKFPLTPSPDCAE